MEITMPAKKAAVKRVKRTQVFVALSLCSGGNVSGEIHDNLNSAKDALSGIGEYEDKKHILKFNLPTPSSLEDTVPVIDLGNL